MALAIYIYIANTLFYIFVFCASFKDHIVKSAAGHFALKRLINQDKERIQSAGDTGKPQKLARCSTETGRKRCYYYTD